MVMKWSNTMPASTWKSLVVVVAVLWSSNASTQDELLESLLPGVQLAGHFASPETDLYVSAYSRIESAGREYIALTYYEPYPDSPTLRDISFALPERVGDEYRLRIDEVAVDGAGSGLELQKPFLYTVDAQDLVVFQVCYRGCRYSMYRLNPAPGRITIEEYVGLGADESFTGRGDTSHFDASGFSTAFNLARIGDASCCPSGGTLNVFYVLRGDRFRISRVEREEAAQEAR